MKKHNFGAGPCILPQQVLKKLAQSVLNFDGLELSLLEISHRSKDFVAVMEHSRALVKEIMQLSDEYAVLFLQGGASLQFIMVPYNLLRIGGRAAYLDTGTWASRAIKEAKKFGKVEVVASSKAEQYVSIPKTYKLPSDVDYFHYTSNNTIYGTQSKSIPYVDVPLVCDMSSDIFSRCLDFSYFDLIYAGAQKNMGPAGATLVVVKKSLLDNTGRDIPSYLDYQIQIAKESMLNTPGVFSVYASMLTLEWIKNQGGIQAIEKLNREKAGLLYEEIDRNTLFRGVSATKDRSDMNATFILLRQELSETFDKMWKGAGIVGLNGHRSVGGYRASMYNALPKESVQVLVDVMKAFENRFT
ncbi:MAG: 3-phosphoserine/phosphohydroxythreonine transaminase [Flavobacteriales bacterium AspAUS03]